MNLAEFHEADLDIWVSVEMEKKLFYSQINIVNQPPFLTRVICCFAAG